mgnify:CR=1 FL=1
MSIDARLAELGITLPQAAAPVAAYVPTVEANGLLHISGQIALAPDGALEIARRSRGTPRIAGRLLRRVRDFALVDGHAVVTAAAADAAVKLITAGVLTPDSEVTYNRLGFTDTDKAQLARDKATSSAVNLVAQIANAANPPA